MRKKKTKDFLIYPKQNDYGEMTQAQVVKVNGMPSEMKTDSVTRDLLVIC